MKNIAIIPARGGSKRIPRKNIKLFMGKPIIAYSIEAALKSGIFDEVMVSTDDNEIADIAKKYGASVPFLRSDETSNDLASTADVITEVLLNYERLGVVYDNFCCLYATAPFVTTCRLKQGLNSLIDGANASFTIVNYSYPTQRCLILENAFVKMANPEFMGTRTQDLSKTYHDAGQFYFSKVSSFYKEKVLWQTHTCPIILSELEVQDLDNETDWKIAEMKFKIINEK